MHAIAQFAGDFPNWQTGAEQRLRLSMVLAAVVVAGILSLVKLPPPAEFGPLLELVVELTRPEPLVQPEPEVVPPPPLPLPVPEIIEEQQPAATVPEPATEVAPVEEQAADEGAAIDWEIERDKAIKAVLDAIAREDQYTVNPRFEAARREARVRFRASLAPDAVNAWDSVEKDQMGRTILRLGDGNCFQVLDDPSAVNRWAFETFDRNLVYCDFFFGGKKGKELPWVEIIRERYPYLRDPVVIP
jgi:hypothetical protein